MPRRLSPLAVAVVLTAAAVLPAEEPQPEQQSIPAGIQSLLSCRIEPANLQQLALAAVSADEAAAQDAITRLRSAGPEGLAALASLQEQYERTAAAGGTAVELRRLRSAMDAVASQRYAWASRLYWHTDIEQARAAAKHLGKPILSLRLLGNLTDEYSCANSRFFRTTLYANAEVSAYLRDHFVLHWQSVRPVPQVTVDFGDGRKLRMTLTGNSIHYVLDAEGNLVDALPGLYGPAAFLRGLHDAETIAKQLADAPADERGNLLTSYHRRQFSALTEAWTTDLREIGVETAQAEAPQPPVRPAAAQGNPRAVDASVIARPKMAIEARPLELLFAGAGRRLAQLTADEHWPRIAERHAADAELDAASVELIRSQRPTAAEAGAEDGRTEEDRFAEMLASFRDLVALDSVRNEYLLRRQIHEWFLAGQVADVDSLNERVYAELFLTPKSDPWLGLLPRGTYTALESDGLVR